MKIVLYWVYLLQWYVTHSNPAFKGCEPACYNEWLDNEYQEWLEERRNK